MIYLILATIIISAIGILATLLLISIFGKPVTSTKVHKLIDGTIVVIFDYRNNHIKRLKELA